MFDQLTESLRGTEAILAGLDPRSMIGTQPAVGLELLDRHERAVAAARSKLTARAAEMNHWQRQGYRSFEDWLAATFGTSPGAARRKARAAKKLADRQRTARALENGDISEDEADVIADAADKNPEAETELLDTAKNKDKSHDDLKDEAADAKAAGEDDQARAERLRRGRTARVGTDRDGFWTLHAKLQPDVGAELKAHLQAETDRIFNQARRDGTREPLDRYRADALTALILGHARDSTDRPTDDDAPADTDRTALEDQLDLELGLTRDRQPGLVTEPSDPSAGPRSPVSRAGRELVLVIDLAALRRGCVNPGETCHIRGVGPVPVEVARGWVDDAFVKAVIRDGVDVHTVAHHGRHIPAHLRTALDLTDTTCAVPGCSNRRIEYDHKERHADMGVCSTENLRPLCVHHHRQRTHDGYELEGEPGDRRWLHPDGRVLFADRSHHLTTEPARAP